MTTLSIILLVWLVCNALVHWLLLDSERKITKMDLLDFFGPLVLFVTLLIIIFDRGLWKALLGSPIYLVQGKVCVKAGRYRFICSYVDKNALLHNNWSREGSVWGVYRYRVIKKGKEI